MSMRVKIIITVCLIASYFFVDGIAMARYQRLHPTMELIDCERMDASYETMVDYYDCRRDVRRNGNNIDVAAGVFWPVYLIVSFGIEMGENHE